MAVHKMLFDFKSKIHGKRTDTANQVNSLRQELVKAQQRNALQILTSPVDGRVQELVVHTEGGVVNPAQPLMKIVPDDFQLEVESMLLNKDIGFVHEGQEVAVKVEAFPFTEYGMLQGVVRTVSTDAVQDEELGLVYAVYIDINQQHIHAHGRDFPLSPGMNVTSEIKLRKRRIIEFFLSPLLKYAQESMRER